MMRSPLVLAAVLAIAVPVAAQPAQPAPAAPAPQPAPSVQPAPTVQPAPGGVQPVPTPVPVAPAVPGAPGPDAPPPVPAPPAGDPTTPAPPAGPPVVRELPPAVEPSPPDDGLTTSTFHYHRPFRLHWGLLNLPERIIQLTFVPIGLLVAVTEEKRLDKRIATLFKFGNFKVAPRFKLSFGDGLGAGLKLKYKQPTGARRSASLGFIYRLNKDYLIDSKFEQPVGTFNDRRVYGYALVERDVNERFYGIGGDSSVDSKRALTNNHQFVHASVDLQPANWVDNSGLFTIGLFRQTLAEGISTSTPPITAMDTIPPPPGFGSTVTYLNPVLSATHDTRDTQGRPSRGLVAQASAEAMIGISDSNLGGLKFKAEAQWYLPVLPQSRTFVVDVGGIATVPLFSGDLIPLATYAELGRDNHLRGYSRTRFRDRYAVWASGEYRYPIFEYEDTGVGLDSFVFLDTATAFGDDKLSASNIRYSYGGGFRLAAETGLVSELTLGFSPEGFVYSIGGEAKF